MDSKVLKNSFLYMYGSEPISDFLKDCEISISKQNMRFGTTYNITFTVSATTFKKYEVSLPYFQAKLKEDLHKYHQFKSVLVDLTADWEKLEIISNEVVPVLTPWQEINNMQDILTNQIHTSTETISFQNVGNTARNLLRKLSEIVFVKSKHAPKDNNIDTSSENFKNRLWSFVLYKFPESSTNKKVIEYAKSLLECSDKGINLSNAVTHSLNADAFLAKSCAISTISTIHFVKLAYDRPDPV